MNHSSISNSDTLSLSPKQSVATLLVVVLACSFLYTGWFGWERFEPGPDYRPPCWGSRMSDYWAIRRWMQAAAPRHAVLILGDSVIWGQEVRHDQTISHYLNQLGGAQVFANVGLDGLHPAAIAGLVKYHGAHFNGNKVLLQFNPFWMSTRDMDLQGDWKEFFHPRLISQISSRIHYQKHDLHIRLGYAIENRAPIFALARHISVNYFDNMGIDRWMLHHPYSNPVLAVTFRAAPVIEAPPGRGLSWEAKEMKKVDSLWLKPTESVQWSGLRRAIASLQRRDVDLWVLLGPYNPYIFSDASRQRMDATLAEVRQWFSDQSISHIELGGEVLASELFADEAGHLLDEGHRAVAAHLLKDATFGTWASIR